MSCGEGRRLGLDPKFLWLWLRLAAMAPIRPLAQEPPYAMGAALEKAKKRQKNKMIWEAFVLSLVSGKTFVKEELVASNV